MTNKHTPQDRLIAACDDYSQQHNDDNAVPRLNVNAADIRAVCQINADLLETLEFYSDPINYIYWEGKFCEFKEQNQELTHYNSIGAKARAAIAKVRGE